MSVDRGALGKPLWTDLSFWDISREKSTDLLNDFLIQAVEMQLQSV